MGNNQPSFKGSTLTSAPKNDFNFAGIMPNGSTIQYQQCQLASTPLPYQPSQGEQLLNIDVYGVMHMTLYQPKQYWSQY